MIGISSWILFATAALAQPVDVALLVEQTLDEPAEIVLTDVSVKSAFETVAEQTGVDLRVSTEVLAMLPHGGDTIISATLKGMPLREGLSRMLSHLGMYYEVAGRGVDVLPTPALQRIGRRAAWSELATLSWLHESRWNEKPEPLEELRGRLQFQIDVTNPWSDLQTAVQRVGAGPGDEVLSLACDSKDWTWYPSGDEIVVLSKVDDLQRQLTRRVEVRYNGRPFWEVLQDLGHQIGVPIQTQPGTIASLSRDVQQRFTLLVDGGTAVEALEAIASTTGLGYRLQVDGVVFFQPDATTAAASPPTQSNPYRAKVVFPNESGVQIEVLIREGDLSPEGARLLNEHVRKASEILERELKSQQTAGE